MLSIGRKPQPLAGMNLNSHLLLRIPIEALVCLSGAAAWIVYDANRTSRLETLAVATAINKHLELQLMRIDAGYGNADHFPDLSVWQETRSQTGFCLRISSATVEAEYSSCFGARVSKSHYPALFEWVYTAVFHPGITVTRPMKFKGTAHGAIHVTPAKDKELADAWNSIVTLASFISITISAVCLLVYMTISRSLRPARQIVNGLEMLRKGDLSFRLPAFKLIEWQRTGTAINELADNQQQLLAERNKLSHSLIRVQQEERRYLSRELHDELGQCLAAVSAIAASIEHSAKDDCPAIAGDAQQISRINQQIMNTVRMLLLRFRPDKVCAPNLQISLQQLIADWETKTRGKPQYSLLIHGNFDDLAPEIASAAYRIVQECLSNAVKHANATMVSILVEASNDTLEFAVTDDGIAHCLPFEECNGIGLVGIRERVAALEGELSLSILDPTGLHLKATLPFQKQSTAAAGQLM